MVVKILFYPFHLTAQFGTHQKYLSSINFRVPEGLDHRWTVGSNNYGISEYDEETVENHRNIAKFISMVYYCLSKSVLMPFTFCSCGV